MGLGHDHHDGDGHSRHAHLFDRTATVPLFADPTVPDRELAAADIDRRQFLVRLGIFGAAVGGASVVGSLGGQRRAFATPAPIGGSVDPAALVWLAGDHHIHTQYSVDAQYRVDMHTAKGQGTYGLDWMVITDHGRAAHEKVSVPLVNADIRAIRSALPGLLLFQGLEWNIPAAEHGTVFIAPPANASDEVAVLRYFEANFDGVVKGATAQSAANEALALSGIDYLAQVSTSGGPGKAADGSAVANVQVADALFLANHPARKGLDSPHEVRGWRDRNPLIAVGWEGAPGHQAAALAGSLRGFYDNTPDANAFAGFPPEAYRTQGGFDWFSAVVGGLWDSMLVEGKPWWITANSDSHTVYKDTLVRPNNPLAVPARAYNTADYDGTGPAGTTTPPYGKYPDPVDSGTPQTKNGDYWPGQYSRTWVGAADRSYTAVMEGIRAGRVWVVHGDLIRSLSVSVRLLGASAAQGVTLGGRIAVAPGSDVEIVITAVKPTTPNFNGDLPNLARLDIVGGLQSGAQSNRDTFLTSDVRVAKQFDVSATPGTVTVAYTLTDVQDPFFLRLRGHDGRFTGKPTPVDPTPPRQDPAGIDPWTDLWFYTNPIFVDLL